MIQILCNDILAGIDIRKNLIELNSHLKNEDERETFLDFYYENEAQMMSLLDHEDPKVRKNIIRVLGNVADQAAFEPLMNHYQQEETMFLKADYLQAVAEMDYTDCLEMFKARLKTLESTAMDKHTAAEAKALRKLIMAKEPQKKHTFTGWHIKQRVLFLITAGHEALLESKIREADPSASVNRVKGGCFVVTEALMKLIDLRLYQAVLFDLYPKMIPSSDGTVIGKTLADDGMAEKIAKRFEGSQPILFRVEVKGVKDPDAKNKLARKLGQALEEGSSGRMINDPSAYEVEIRAVASVKGTRVFVRFTTIGDKRFAYRKQSTATSMQPSRAALLMTYMAPYMKDKANVLDPFCGTGTLLIERFKCQTVRPKALYGIDISGPDLEAAERNAQSAGVITHLIRRNFDDFKHEYQFDEIITDMPKQSEKNALAVENTYPILFRQAEALLSARGVMAVYTDNEKMMERMLRNNRWIKRAEKIMVTPDAKGWFYILKRED